MKKLICKIFGHDYQFWLFGRAKPYAPYYSASHCNRCGKMKTVKGIRVSKSSWY